MYDRIRNLMLAALKVPPEPHPPAGDPASLRVFRAGRNYFKLRLAGWGFGQLLALAGIVFWLVVLIQVESDVHRRKQAQPANAKPSAESFEKRVEAFAKDVEKAVKEQQAAGGEKTAAKIRKRARPYTSGWAGFKQGLVEIGSRLPDWAFPLIWLLKIGGFLAYLGQIPVTFLLLRLDYEMRWYIVTDRSLRLRSGTWKVQETTMSFANLQQVEVTQGPLQRLLGLADVRVQSAGGGGGGPEEKHADDSMHRARFHGVDNASEIRDLILDRLRRYRASGLGDPDDHHDDAPAAPAVSDDLVTAARELAAEARALRQALG